MSGEIGMNEDMIKNIVNEYGITLNKINDVIDSSHGEDDIRLTYIINQEAVLHCATSSAITEDFLFDIDRLVQRHRSIGIYAPKLYPLKDSRHFLYQVEKENKVYSCYIEEKAPYTFLSHDEVDFYQMKENVVPFLGKLANKYRDVYLSSTYSMWSIIDLSPFDDEIDEKQENLNSLCEALEHDDLRNRIQRLNHHARTRIKQHFSILPRCVFQGDLNLSNCLFDESKQFKGLIDFNMFGTDVNVNCFLNESMYYLEEQDFNTLTPQEIFLKMVSIQNHLMSKILANYTLNEVELAVFHDYQFIIWCSFYPNAMLMIELLKTNHQQKVIQFLEMVCNEYEKY